MSRAGRKRAKPERRAALYARVSTSNGHQDPDVQLTALREVADRAGWQVVGEYTDNGVSGSVGRSGRRAFDGLLRDATRREFDVVAAWSVDRLGRSLQDLLAFLQDIQSAGVDLYLHQQGLDTSTPSGRAMFQMLGVFSEFERCMIQERVRAGLAKARANGKRLGRPPALDDLQVRGIRIDRERGMSLRALATKYRTSAPTIRRALGGNHKVAGLVKLASES